MQFIVLWTLYGQIVVVPLYSESLDGAIMNEIEDFLNKNKKILVDEVEGELSMIHVVSELLKKYPMSHGQIDKVHQIWARSLRDALWLGWLSEAKRRRGAYNDNICKDIEDSLIQAFKIGQKYAIERP